MHNLSGLKVHVIQVNTGNLKNRCIPIVPEGKIIMIELKLLDFLRGGV